MAHIDYGRGQAAINVGQSWDVYRTAANAATKFVDPLNHLFTGFKCLNRISKEAGDHDTSEHMGSLFFRMVCDATKLFTGDVLIQNDPFYGLGGDTVDYTTLQFEGMCMAYHNPLKETIGVRLDRTAQIYRPSLVPDTTGTDPNKFWTVDLDNSTPLILTNGVFSFGTQSQTAAAIPMGFMSMSRVFETLYKDISTDTKSVRYFIYVPPLQGYTVREGDRIVAYDGSRYVVQHPYRQESGLVGSQLVAMRTVGQP